MIDPVPVPNWTDAPTGADSFTVNAWPASGIVSAVTETLTIAELEFFGIVTVPDFAV